MNEFLFDKEHAAPSAAIELTLALARTLHEHGTPAHRLEQSLVMVARGLGIGTAQFMSTPTAIQLGFGDGTAQQVYLQRLHREWVDLEALGEINSIVDEIAAGELDAPAGLERLHALSQRSPRYGPRATRWASAACSASAALFVGGGTVEIVVAGFIGWGIGAMAQWPNRTPGVRTVYEPLAALLASWLTTIVGRSIPEVTEGVVLFAALIMLVPGLSLTIAMTELASGHLVSGTARLAGAMTLMLTMLFGIALGRELAAGFVIPFGETLPSVPLNPGVWPLGLVVFAGAFTVLLRARPRDFTWIALACALGYGASHLGRHELGPVVGAFVGATTIGIASNAFARGQRRPAALLRLPGLLLLVPGSMGLRSLSSLMDADTIAGTDGLFQVALIAVALATGSFAADLVLPPRRSL